MTTIHKLLVCSELNIGWFATMKLSINVPLPKTDPMVTLISFVFPQLIFMIEYISINSHNDLPDLYHIHSGLEGDDVTQV